MNRLSTFFLVICSVVVLAGRQTYAQAQENPLLVVSSNMVPMGDIDKVNKMVDSVFAPILKGMVDEKFIYGWGQFNHSWGDEWNLNFWYVAKDMSHFDKFWDEYVSRVGKQHPTAFAVTTKYFQAHKDNFYTIRTQYPVPPRQ